MWGNNASPYGPAQHSELLSDVEYRPITVGEQYWACTADSAIKDVMLNNTSPACPTPFQ